MAVQRAPLELQPPNKWEVQLRKGSLELAILACLWPKKLYGLEIMHRLEGDARLMLSAGTIYPLLSRLKADGLLRSEWVEAQTGHPRKYYQLTPAGRERVTQMMKTWSDFSAGLENLFSPILKDGKK